MVWSVLQRVFFSEQRSNRRIFVSVFAVPGSDIELDYRGSASAFVLRGLNDRSDVRVLLEHLAQGFAEDAHATAVDDANAR